MIILFFFYRKILDMLYRSNFRNTPCGPENTLCFVSRLTPDACFGLYLVLNQVPNASPTAASASSDLYGAAVLDACEQLKARMEPIASKSNFSSFAEVRLPVATILPLDSSWN